MAPPTIHINDIPDTGLELEIPLDAAWVRASLAETGVEPSGDPAGKANVRLDLNDREVLLHGSIAATVEMQCVRCLEPAKLPVETTFTLVLEPAPSAQPSTRKGAPEEIDLDAEQLDMDHYENDRVDLAHWLREQILLEAPAYPTCPNGCKAPIAMPAQPNEERGIDPRLAPLMKLSNKEK